MSPDILFVIANGVAALAWVLLAAVPGPAWVTDVVTGRVVPMLFASAYIAIVVTTFPGAEGSFSSVSGVALLFRNEWLLVAGWLHYLAFDLLIGSWEARDSVERGVPRWLLVPCLFLTLMFGPAGWLAYRAVRMRRWTPESSA